ncbi:MAG: hypothetical protein U0L09_09115 [Christensenellales bacterium]|nr:hypothetical protein [Christensenellales bacterium]
MKKFSRVMIAFCFLFLICTAQAEPTPASTASAVPEYVLPLIPEGAAILEGNAASSYRCITFRLNTGETLELTWNDRSNAPVSLITLAPAQNDDLTTPSRPDTEALLLTCYPDAHILFSQNDEQGSKILYLITETFCGSVTVGNNAILSRNLTWGNYYRERLLTMEGALAALSIYRSDAVCYALDLEQNGGFYFYEGNAFLNNEKYEFQLDAFTGQLVEWERT